jgi:hypothetical protein
MRRRRRRKENMRCEYVQYEKEQKRRNEKMRRKR